MNRRHLTQGPAVPAIRTRPLAAACAMALLLASGATWAQDQASQDTTQPPAKTDAKSAKDAKAKKSANPDNTATLDAVVVTGIQGAIQNSLKAKQQSSNIIEAISAEDIGKLPDSSIAESLARVPGLATQRIDGRANQISIRGLSPDFVGTTLNGREQATIGENRGVDFDQYPSELISGVTVYKTPDASLVGQGLSGTVDLHTIRPLDLPKAAFAANLRGETTDGGSLNHGSGVGDTGHRASVSYIDQYFDHTLGLAVGFAQLDSPIQEKQYQAWWWSLNNGPQGAETNWGAPHTPGIPDNVLSQEGMQLRAKSQNQLRNGLMTVLEWAPDDHYHSTLDLYYSTVDEKTHLNGAQWSSSPYDNVSYSNVGVQDAVPYPIVTTGHIDGLKAILQNEYTKEKDKLFSAGWNNQYDFGNGWFINADAAYSMAKRRLHDAYLFAGLPGEATSSTDFSNPANFGFPDFTPGTNFADPSVIGFTDPNNYGYDGRAEYDKQKDTIKSFRLEVSHPVGWIFSDFNLGVNYSDREKTKDADVFFAWLNGNGSDSATYQPGFSSPIDPSFLSGVTDLSYGGIPGIVNYDVMRALGSQYYLTQRNGQADWSRNYTVREKVPVAYIKFNLDTSAGGVPITGNMGVQVVRTDQSSQALQTNGDTLVGRISDGARYTKVLPSLNVVAEVADKQFLRFGLAKTMARGRIDDEKVATSAGVAQVTDGPAAGQVLWSGSGGNPQLKPYIAVGVDLSWEKYFGDASYVAAAVFGKNLLNYIYNQTVLDYDFSKYTNDNPTLTPTSTVGSFTTPQNGTGGKVKGLELQAGIEGKLLTPALDGFGAQGNFSLTNSTLPVSAVSSIPGSPSTLPGLSRKVANLALYYEKYGWSFRIAERYRSSFTGEAVALFDQLGYQTILPDRQTDLQIGYEFEQGRFKGLSYLLQVNNLTNSPEKWKQTSALPNNVSVGRPLEYNTFGRTFMLGVNFKM
ncbi:TonB-dependent receptor [Bacillus sp. NP157]|nr:TonB-dependent receptor [Bacillus sp. NP157]